MVFMLDCVSFPPLAQWLEQKTHNLLVVGSSPSGGIRLSLKISGTFLLATLPIYREMSKKEPGIPGSDQTSNWSYCFFKFSTHQAAFSGVVFSRVA